MDVAPPVTRASVGSRLADLHERLLRSSPGVDRVAVAVHDQANERLRTFVHSTDAQSPLRLYETRFGKVPSLLAVAATGRPRVIEDLRVLPTPHGEHTRALIDAGYRSSLTLPLTSTGELVGFLFLDSRHPGRFTPGAVERLGLFTEAVSLLVRTTFESARMMRTTVRMATELSRARDRETGEHLARMARYTRLIAVSVAEEVGLEDEVVEFLTLYAPLHDLGKVGVPDDVLLKPGPLSGDEWQTMQRHVETGAEIVAGLQSDGELGALPHLHLLQQLVRHHHEALDGSGYPDGLAGEEIPFPARVVAVADAFDALTTARPYKPAWSVDDAFALLSRRAGSTFDPRCVQALVASRGEVEEARRRFAEDTPSAPAHDHEWGTMLG